MIPPGVRVESLDRDRTLSCLLPLKRFLQRERPDIFLSNLPHNNLVSIGAAALARVPTRIVASHHAALAPAYSAYPGWHHRILPLMYRLSLRHAHGNVAVSEGLADEIAAIAKLARDRITVIYNPVVLADFDDRMAEAASHPWLTDDGPPFLLGVGRLAPQKDFKTLLSAFSIVARVRDVRLLLLGEGPQQAELVRWPSRSASATAWACPASGPTPSLSCGKPPHW